MNKKKRPKKADEAKGKGADEKKIPDAAQIAGAVTVARYGQDASAPLLGHLIQARASLVLRPRPSSEKSLLGTLLDDAIQRGSDSTRGLGWFPLFESVAKAIFEGDGGFFREVGRLLEERVNGHAERRVDMEVARAFLVLRARAEQGNGPLPTKKQVREAALFSMASANLLQRKSRGKRNALKKKASPTPVPDLSSVPKGNSPLPFPPKLAAEVKREMELLPEQDWTAVFKRCGLAHLPNDKGGQPTQRRNQGAGEGGVVE